MAATYFLNDLSVTRVESDGRLNGKKLAEAFFVYRI